MDRGRCGLDLESNRFLREKKLTQKRNDHLARLKKIKHRKPGSSVTLDNTAPECMFCDRFKSDPRKVSKRKERNNIIERENKVLLQRISHILTAPPRITDASYRAMKKLLSTLADTNSFNKKLKDKYNKQFFERVNKTTPYYNHKVWEQEYEEQLRGQKFMRQVLYKRPDNWVDPFQEKPLPEDYGQARARRRREKEAAKSGGASSDMTDEPDAFARSTGDLSDIKNAKGGHVNKVKKLRASKSNPNPRKKEAFGKDRDSKLASSGLDRDAIDNQSPAPFKSRLLARTERTIPVHTPGSIRAGQPPNQSGAPTPSDNRRKNSSLSDNNDVTESEKGTAVTACVICSLVEDSYLYITVDGVEKQLHAEALVHVNSLFLSEAECAEGKTQENFPLDDAGAQEWLAVDIADNISLLKTVKNDYQVMLPWCSTSSAGNSAAHSRRVSSTSTHPMDMTSIMNAVDSNDEADCGQDDLGQSVENNEREHDDLDECFTPITVSCGIKATVSCGVEPDDVNSRMKMRKQKENLGVQEFIPEEMFMLVKITRVGEEKARVVVHTIRDSVNLFQKRPVLPANTRLELLIALPSVLTVESELMEDYFKNAAINIRVEHSQDTGENVLILD